jgi:integrase
MINFKTQDLPEGITKIISPISGQATFEAYAGRAFGAKVRKRFGAEAFESEAAALAAAKYWLADKRRELKDDRAAVMPPPSDRDRLLYAEALERLQPYGKTLLEAVDMAIKGWKEEAVESIAFSEAAGRYLAHMQLKNSDPEYLRNLRIAMNALEGEFGDRMVSEITTDELQMWLMRRNIKPITWNSWRRDIKGFFSFCLEKRNRWLKTNPAEEIVQKTVDALPVSIYDVTQAERLLAGAMKHCPKHVPWMVLGMFLGFRPGEADRARWEHINWNTEPPSIECIAMKNRDTGHRFVDLTPPAIAYLSLLKQESGPMATCSRTRRDTLTKLSKRIGIDCVSNDYRHSYGSYLNAIKGDAYTMRQMGHTNVRTFHNWYKRPLPTSTANAFWAIRPETFG